MPEFLSHHTQGHFNENSKVQAKRIELLLILQQCRHLIPRPSGVITVCLQSTAKQTEEGSVGKCRLLQEAGFQPLFLCRCAVLISQDPVACSLPPINLFPYTSRRCRLSCSSFRVHRFTSILLIALILLRKLNPNIIYFLVFSCSEEAKFSVEHAVSYLSQHSYL